MTDKYFKLREDLSLTFLGRKLFRIEATKDLKKHNVKAGDIGGYIEKEENLSGNAWVCGNAKVYGNAEVWGNACKENNTKLNFCKNNHNCNYKQLQRKTAECEELKKALAIKTGKDYINEIQDIQMKYECHQKSLGMCWWGKYGKETECIGIRECHKKELEVIKNLEHKLHIATEALKSILDEADVLDEFISKEGYLCGFVNIAQQALEQLGSEE